MPVESAVRNRVPRYRVCPDIQSGGPMRIRVTAIAAVAAAAIALTGIVASSASGHDADRPITTGCPTANPPAEHDVVTYNDGWIDGCADSVGDDNRDGRLSPGEAGWACRHTQLADLQACLTRAYAAEHR